VDLAGSEPLIPEQGAKRAAWKALIGVALTATTVARAEPVFAVRTGYSCGQCHINRVGGGLRTPFGSLYTQTTLPAHLLTYKGKGYPLPADPQARFAVGGDARFGYDTLRSDQAGDSASFELAEANLYGQFRVVPERFSLYIDQRFGSGGSSTRELFALFVFGGQRAYVKAGRIFPPYGWAIPDDTAFIRQPLGFAFSTSDVGVEIGFDPGNWSTQLALVNGSAGQRDADLGKKLTFLSARRFKHGTIGLTAAYDDASRATTAWGGILGGLNFGRFSLLAEYDERATNVETSGDDLRFAAAFFEVDVLIQRGLSLKYAHDWMDPDRSVPTDRQQRDTLGVEYIPYPFVQLRLFLRRGDGPPQVTGATDSQADLEAHFFF
jgi:hypothetical protein